MKVLQHLSVIVIITIIMALIYATVQQAYRSNANDPQTQVAYDLKDQLQKGKPVESLFRDTLDLEKSLAVFIETYDAHGKPIQSNGYLNGKFPQLPRGVLEYVKEHGEHWVTWQPQPNVRMAMGLLKVNAGPVSYVAVGRSLKETEERVSGLVTMIFISWTICMAIVCINWLIHYFNVQKINPIAEA
jgi:hypothetical protein